MTKEEYLEKRQSINEKIKSLQLELKDLENSFILANAEFNIGEKVILSKGTKKERFAYINRIVVSMGVCAYSLLKSKKDGDMSKNADYLCYEETISKID